MTLAAWKMVEANYVWKLRHQMVLERRTAKKHLEGTPWWPKYQELVKENHPVLRGEWKG